MNREDYFKGRLRLAGERVTTPRLSVFRVLWRQGPLPMGRLIAKAQADGVDPVTTYRTVDLFRKLDLLQEVGLGRNRLLELSESQTHHHHFTCTECGRITEFDSDAIEADLRRLAEHLGYAIRSHQLEVTGLCAACQKAVS